MAVNAGALRGLHKQYIYMEGVVVLGKRGFCGA